MEPRPRKLLDQVRDVIRMRTTPTVLRRVTLPDCRQPSAQQTSPSEMGAAEIKLPKAFWIASCVTRSETAAASLYWQPHRSSLT